MKWKRRIKTMLVTRYGSLTLTTAWRTLHEAGPFCLLQDEVRFSLVSTGTANSDKALDYFYIIELTGAIYLRRPLTADPARDSRFTVSTRSHLVVVSCQPSVHAVTL